MWMEQLEEDVRHPMQQEKGSQDGRSAGYVGDSVGDELPCEETGSDRDEDV